MNEYRIIRLSAASIEDLSIIYKNAFGYDLDLKAFLKKQNTLQFGDALVGFIAYDQENNPAAFYGVYPCKIEFNGRLFLAAQSGDTMTHSDHTGKGLFTKLALETYQYCRENGFHCVFGFPNENSFPGFIKRLGWSHFDDMVPYLIRVKCLPWIRLKNTFKLPQKMHNSWCRLILKTKSKGVPFQSSCLNSNVPVVDHSSDFFKYKTYGENYLIKVFGINVWIKFDDTFLFIGDIEKCEEHQFVKVSKGLKRLAFMMGLPHLRFHASSQTWGSAIFEKYGVAMEVKYPVGGINFTNEIPLEQLKFTGADNDTF
jgi:GNAT superfamily N-acetyltransferase